jgi:tryptophan-rich sensory protein
MGLALAMIINARGSTLRGPALVVFAVQMAANLSWSPVFFGMHQVMAALIILAILFVLALITVILFGRIRIGAALLLLPYLAWIGFAAYLLFQINELNPNAASLVPSRSADQIQIH